MGYCSHQSLLEKLQAIENNLDPYLTDPISLEDFDQSTLILGCGHSYHAQTIENLLYIGQGSINCPTCQQSTFCAAENIDLRSLTAHVRQVLINIKHSAQLEPKRLKAEEEARAQMQSLGTSFWHHGLKDLHSLLYKLRTGGEDAQLFRKELLRFQLTTPEGQSLDGIEMILGRARFVINNGSFEQQRDARYFATGIITWLTWTTFADSIENTHRILRSQEVIDFITENLDQHSSNLRISHATLWTLNNFLRAGHLLGFTHMEIRQKVEIIRNNFSGHQSISTPADAVFDALKEQG